MNKRIKKELQEKHIRKLKRGWDKSRLFVNCSG